MHKPTRGAESTVRVIPAENCLGDLLGRKSTRSGRPTCTVCLLSILKRMWLLLLLLLWLLLLLLAGSLARVLRIPDILLLRRRRVHGTMGREMSHWNHGRHSSSRHHTWRALHCHAGGSRIPHPIRRSIGSHLHRRCGGWTRRGNTAVG